MSINGLSDNVAITGTVTTSNVSVDVNGYGTQFLLDFDAGDYITIASNKYQIANVTSNVLFALNANCATNSDNVAAYVQTGPKYVGNADIADNVYSIHKIYGVDVEEAEVPENKEKNIKTPGWTHYLTYTDGYGQTRHKAEVLIALSKAFKSANIGDAIDDAVVLDTFIYFTTQPEDQIGIEANSNVTLQVVADSIPAGASISYQWYESPNNVVFAEVVDAGVYSGNTTNTLAISNVDGLNAYFYYVEISATAANTNVSSTVTLEFV